MCNAPQHRDRAQATHNAANAQSVSDGLAQAVLFGDVKIGDRAWLIPTDLKRCDHKIGTVQRLTTIQVGRDRCACAYGLDHRAGQNLAFGQTAGVDVHQRKVAVGKGRGQQCVAHDILHKDRRAGTDKGDLCHVYRPKEVVVISRRPK